MYVDMTVWFPFLWFSWKLICEEILFLHLMSSKCFHIEIQYLVWTEDIWKTFETDSITMTMWFPSKSFRFQTKIRNDCWLLGFEISPV